MPQAIAAAIVTAIGLTGVAATIATAVIALAISVGLSALATSIFGRGGTSKPSDVKQIKRVAVGSRVRHYGKVRVGGQLSFYESRNGTLYSLVTTGHGQINAVNEYLLNSKPVTVDGAGQVTSISYTKKGTTRYPISMFSKLGTDDQTAYSQLTSVFAEWTTNHRQRGCSNVLVICAGVDSEFFSDVYEGSREPEPQVTMESSLVYDPRKDSTNGGSGSHRLNDRSTWEYADNWALCFADYLAHEDGYGLGYDMINWATIADEADICDITVTTVDERVIPQWRVAGSYQLSQDERRTVIKEFLKAGDGFMWQDAQGLANIRCGRWIEPTVHIPEKHILGCTASLGTDPQDRANEVRMVYMEPLADYSETEAAPLVDEPARIALGRSEVVRFDAYYIPDHNQAQRVGKRLLKKLGDRWSLTMTTNLYGLNVIGERFITVTITELAIVNMAFEVTSLKIDPLGLNVELGLTQVEEADFDFDAETEEGTPPNEVPSTSVPIVIEEMADLTLSSILVTLSGSTGVAIRAVWDEPLRVGLQAQVQYRPTGSTEWLEMAVNQDDFIATSGIVTTGVEYEVQGRLLTISGRTSDWTDPPETITPSSAVAPSVPTELGVTPGAAEADLTWRNPPEANFGFARLYRGTTSTFGSATAVIDIYGGLSEVMFYTDDDGGSGLAADDYWWWVAAYDASGTLFSSPAGPVTGTVT